MSRLIVSYEDHYEVCHLLGRCCLVLLQEGSLHCQACLKSRIKSLCNEYFDVMGKEMVVLQMLLDEQDLTQVLFQKKTLKEVKRKSSEELLSVL
jgi:hypothetical protein